MSSINPQKTYLLNEGYESIKERALQILHKYLEYPDLISFNDLEQSITFFSEKLIPTSSKNRPRVMFLFSNPHPHSIHQGMFLSPNTIGRENLFWPVMENAGWLPIAKEKRSPEQLRDICLNADHEGLFELIFYAYYAFPTDYPEDIKRIFGMDFFRQIIEPEAMDDFKKTIHDTSVEAIVTFNKGIFNLVSKDPKTHYIERLKKGEMIQSQIKDIDKSIPIFLTYPTGWHYDAQYMKLRGDSLDTIRKTIGNGSNDPEA